MSKNVVIMSGQTTILEELGNIIKALKIYPNGAAFEDIETESNLRLPRRTLQRRLLALRDAGKLHIEGKTRAARYFLTATHEAKSDELPNKVDSDTIPLSSLGREILEFVKRPLQDRAPVGYNRDFLDHYQANKSSYLTCLEIEKLTQIGKLPITNQPAGTYAKETLSRLLIDLSWNSSRLEGNTYSLLDTQRLIVFGQIAENKSATEAQMILNHKEAIEFLTQSTEDIGFNRYTILNLHALLSNNLLPDPSASGRLRSIDIGIYKSVYLPLAVPQLISELFNIILEKAEQIKNPFEQAFFIMVHLPYLQPFDDVNKRVSRLAANIPFIRHNLSPLSFIDMPEDIYIHGMISIYELNRIELLKDIFIWAYKRSAARYSAIRQSLGEPDPFRFKYREDIKDLISIIISQSYNLEEASEKIKSKAKELSFEDQKKFIEAVETELLSLHEGNFARYRIRPSEFNKWEKMINKNNQIQKLANHFKIGLKSFPFFRFQFDTNQINARRKLDSMNQLEEWAKNDIITLNFSDTVLAEVLKPSRRPEREQEISKRISGELFTMSFSEDEQDSSFKAIESILFPDGCDENQMNDVRIVFHAYKHHYILITDDGASKRQPRGILGNALTLKARLNITVMRNSEAVKMVQGEIDKLNELAKSYSKETGMPLELFA